MRFEYRMRFIYVGIFGFIRYVYEWRFICIWIVYK